MEYHYLVENINIILNVFHVVIEQNAVPFPHWPSNLEPEVALKIVAVILSNNVITIGVQLIIILKVPELFHRHFFWLN